jgi:hypothetical protein
MTGDTAEATIVATTAADRVAGTVTLETDAAAETEDGEVTETDTINIFLFYK